jgi:hypothetical protein
MIDEINVSVVDGFVEYTISKEAPQELVTTERKMMFFDLNARLNIYTQCKNERPLTFGQGKGDWILPFTFFVQRSLGETKLDDEPEILTGRRDYNPEEGEGFPNTAEIFKNSASISDIILHKKFLELIVVSKKHIPQRV